MKRFLSFILALALPVHAGIVDAAKSSGIQGDLVVHIGCGNGQDTARLRFDERFCVQGLDTDPDRIAEARKHLQGKGLYGSISVRTFDGKCLVPEEDILRVLVPNGKAIIEGKTVTKPWPDEIDEWTHFLHGPDNNAVAQDRRVAMPRSLQWVSEPRWGRSHEESASMSAAVSAKGRIFYILDEAPLASIRFLGNWKLAARDAFNGVLLWKKAIPQWTDHLRHFRAGPAQLPRRLVAVQDTVYATLGLAGPVVAFDAASGREIRTYAGTEHAEEIVCDDGTLYLAVGSSKFFRRGGGLHDRNEPEATDFRCIAAFDAASGNRRWQKDFTADDYLLPLTLTVRNQRVYYQSSKGMGCLDAGSGNPVWFTPRATPQRRMSFASPTVVATDDVLLCADRNPGNAPATNRLEWDVHG